MLPSPSAPTLAPDSAFPRGLPARAVPGHDRWHPDVPAVAEIITGGSVRLDCLAREPGAEPLLCGPIAVVGALPGDVIVVDVVALGRADGRPARLGHPGVIGCAPDPAEIAAAHGFPGGAAAGAVLNHVARAAVLGDAVLGDAVPVDAVPVGAVPIGAMPGGAVRSSAAPDAASRGASDRASAASSGTARDDAAWGGAERSGTARDGAVRDGAVRSSAVRESAVRGGVVRDGAGRNGMVRDGVVRDRVAPDGAERDGAVRNGAARNGAEPGGATRDGAVWDGIARGVGPGAAGSGGAGWDGVARNGAGRDGAVRNGAGWNGAGRDGAVRDGAVRDGAGRDGAGLGGVVRDGVAGAAPVRDGVRAPVLGGLVAGTPAYARAAAEGLRGIERGRAVGGCGIAPLRAGSRILLPVHVAGAKLSVGDLHFPDPGAPDCALFPAAGWIDLRVNLTRRGVERFRVTGPMLMPDPTPLF